MEEFIQKIIENHKELEYMKQGIRDGSKRTHLFQKKENRNNGQEKLQNKRKQNAISKKEVSSYQGLMRIMLQRHTPRHELFIMESS